MEQAAISPGSWTLDRSITFLNHGSFGAAPKAVLAAQDRYRAEMELEPVRFLGREVVERIDRARARLARFVGAETPDLVFVPNATTGVNSVLRSLRLRPGDEILVTDHGYNACRNAAEFVCEQSDARLVVARVPFPIRSPRQVLEAVLGGITTRTRLALVDHVTSPTGLVFPVRELCAELSGRGVASLVDGAHAPGMLPLSLADLGASYYTGNCHKWLCAPKGAGFLWVRRDLQEGVRPVVISHGANSPRRDRSRFEVEFGWTGTDDPSAYLAVPDAIDFLEGLVPGGWKALAERNRALALEARALLCEALGIEAPAPAEMIGFLASLPLPAGEGAGPAGAFDVDPLQRELFETHRIEVPVMTWPRAPQRLLRVSAQAYNETRQYRALADVLAARLAPRKTIDA